MATFIRFWFYPLLLLATLAFALLALYADASLPIAFSTFAALRLALLLGVELCWPYRKTWAISWRSFIRDLKYAVLVGGTGFALKFGATWLAISAADERRGALAQWPLILQLIIVALTYEFFQYWQHRCSHEARGPLGRFLWRTHLQHHLPRRVYLLMHVVGHPLNFALIFILKFSVLYALGASGAAIYLFGVLLGLQGLVSHFNVQISAGPLNYLLVGTELHRHHHSANLAEAGNYGVLTPFWDIVFGTFRYDANKAPEALGVSAPEHYPTSNQIVATMALPFYPAVPYSRKNDEP